MEITYSLNNDMAGIKNLEKSIRLLKKRHIRFGWYEAKNYPSSHPSGGLSIAQVASWQEYGLAASGKTKAIPSRPYFRQTINKIRYGYRKEIASIMGIGVTGRDTTAKLESLAKAFVLEYQKSVAKQNYKRLSDYTVALKGHSYQMVDSGVMAQSFKARVYRQNQAHIKE